MTASATYKANEDRSKLEKAERQIDFLKSAINQSVSIEENNFGNFKIKINKKSIIEEPILETVSVKQHNTRRQTNLSS